MVTFNTNIPALYTSDELSRITDAINRTIKHLSTGKRIVTAEDEPGSIGYLEKTRAYKIGWERAKLNIEEAKNLLYTADSALTGINGMLDILQRMRELALEAANNATLTTEDRNSIQKEIEELIQEIDRISNVTEYNTKRLLDGSFSGKISASTPYITGYAIGKVETEIYQFSNATGATRAIIYSNYPLPDTEKMPLAFDDSYDATKSLGEAIFSADTTSSADHDADYDIIFTPGNPDYDFIIYRTSTGETVGTGSFGVTFEDPSNPGAKITIYSGSQTIQEGYKGIWHADTNASDNVAQEGNRVVTGTISLGNLSDRAILQGNLYIEFDYVNNKLSYRVTDEEGNPLGNWVSVGATFYAYQDSKLKGSYFTLSVNSSRSGYTGIAGKGDKWSFIFKEYNGLTSSGSLLIEIGEESYSIPWQTTDTVEDLKNRIVSEIGDKVEVEFESSGDRERLKITSKEPGSENTPSIRDYTGNLAYVMGFSVVPGTGRNAVITIDGKTFGPQSSNIFMEAIPNVMLVLNENLNEESGTIYVVDKSQNVKASPKQGADLNFYIPTVNTTTLGLRNDLGEITIDVTTSKGAEEAIGIIDEAISRLSNIASTVGAFEERLTKAYNIAENQAFAATQSLSTIEDVDVAMELVKLTTLEIKRDIATTMLSHANLQPQRIFELLFGSNKT